MSLIRLQLRTAAVLSLAGSDDDRPTMAGPLVFDSKMDPIVIDEGEVMAPVVIVYSDKTELVRREAGSGGPLFSAAETTLIVELAVASFTKGDVKIITTDPEIEAVLDVFEWEVWRRLTDPYAEANKPFLALVKGVTEYTSVPGRAADQANRIAMRQITMTVQTAIDCGVMATIGTPPAAPPAVLFAGVPYLANLAARLDSEPEFVAVAERLRAAITGTPTLGLARLERISAAFYSATEGSDPKTGAHTLVPAPGSRVNVNWSTKEDPQR